MDTKRHLPLLAAMVLIAALILVLIQHRSENMKKPRMTAAPPIPSSPRSSQVASNQPYKHPEEQAGVIDLSEFGQISYARHRVVRVADLMKCLHDDGAFETYMKFCPNVTMDVYEDDKGYLAFLSHNRERFRSQSKDAEALRIMADRGQVITPQIKSEFRMDDDEFVAVLLKKIETDLTFEAYANYPERTKELALWPVTVEYNEKYTGNEEKCVKFPAIMIRHSEGVPSDEYYYKGPLNREETYVRRWNVYRYEKAGDGRNGHLVEVAGKSLLEPRLDLPSVEPPKR